MVNINISLPDELHTRVKLAAALHETSLKDYIHGILKDSASLGNPASKQALSKKDVTQTT